MPNIEIKTVTLKAGTKYLTAYNDNNIIGSVFLEKRGKIAEFWGLEVSPRMQRQGVGSSLLMNVENIAGGDGVNELRGILPAGYRKDNAIKFYKQQGFSIDEVSGTIEKKIRF